MKKILLLSLIFISLNSVAQNVGIGTTTPLSKLHIVSADTGMVRIENTTALAAGVSNAIYFKTGSYFTGAIKHTGIATNASRTGFYGYASSLTSGLKEYMSILDAGNLGIGNTNPILAGLVVDTKVGAVNAIFGSNTTGVAIETSNPGIGFNSYYSSGRKFINNGFGAVLSFDPGSGSFNFVSSAETGTANNLITPTNVFSISNTGAAQLQGINAGYIFADRTLANYGGWNWYADQGKANLYRYTSGGNVLTIDQMGNLGIGNNSPSLGGLVVDTKVGAVNALFGSKTTGVAIETNNPGIGFNSYYNNGRKFIYNGYGGILGFDPGTGGFIFATSTVSGTANNAVTPANVLSVSGSGAVQAQGTNASYTFLDQVINAGNPLWNWHANNGFAALFNSDLNNDALTIDRNGNVKVGSGFPTATLDVSGGTVLANSFNAKGINAGSSATGIQTTASGGTAYNYGILAYSNGVTGTANWPGYFVGNIYALALFQPSDEKLKTNINGYNNALKDLEKLPVKTYSFKEDAAFKNLNLPTEPQVGIMAQDIENVFPQLIKKAGSPEIDEKTHKVYDPKIEFKSVNYTGLIPVLVKSIQEQQQEIVILQKQNADLKTQFEALKTLVDAKLKIIN